MSGSLLEEGSGPKLRGLRGGARYEKDYDDDDENEALGNGKKKKCMLSTREDHGSLVLKCC